MSPSRDTQVTVWYTLVQYITTDYHCTVSDVGQYPTHLQYRLHSSRLILSVKEPEENWRVELETTEKAAGFEGKKVGY
jgi:hypothetical protein